jgi:hypothetical protein
MKSLRSSRPRTRDSRQKGRKAKLTSPQAKMATPHSKRKSQIKGGKEETSTISLPITLYLSITITCLALPLTHLYPLARLPISISRTITNGNIA